MKDSIQKYFQVGTIQWMSHPPISYDLLDSIKSIASDEYFSAVEVTSIMDEETRKKVKHLLEQSPSQGMLWGAAQPLRART